MSFNAGELTSYIDLDDSKFNRTLDRDRDELGRFTGKKHQTTLDIDTTQAQTKLGALSGLIMDNSQQLQSAGMKMTAGFTLPYVIGTALMVKSASSLNEAQNKVNVVFGESSDAVLAWGANAADTIGQSERQALSAAGTFGNLFVSMDMGAEQSAGMSMKLTNLASDLASFNDIDPTEALDALRSGLVGETEPMRRLGVNMNEATLKTQALAMGLQWTGETLPPLVKAQAAYALIMEQTTTAQGDYARTQDEVANSMRGVAADAEDVAASFGEELLPVVKDVLGVARPMLGFFSELPGPVKQAAIVLGGLFAVIGPSLWMLGGMAEGLKALKGAWGAIRTAFTTADSAAIAANTAAVEANTIARGKNALAPAVGAGGTAAGTAAGAVGTGTAGMGAGTAAAAGVGIVAGASVAALAAAGVGVAVVVMRNHQVQAEYDRIAEETGVRIDEGVRTSFGGGRGGVVITNGPQVTAQNRALIDGVKNLDPLVTGNIIASHEVAAASGNATTALDANTTAVEADTEVTKSLAQSMLDEAREAASKGAGVLSNKDFLKYAATDPAPEQGPAGFIGAGGNWVPYDYTGKKAATGADFITNGPELILVGDNASGREHVKVTPGGRTGGGTVINNYISWRSIARPSRQEVRRLHDELDGLSGRSMARLERGVGSGG